MKISVIITAYKEPETIQKAIEHVLIPNQDIWNNLQLIVVAPDEETITKAQVKITEIGYTQGLVLKDLAKGKPAALNMAYKHATGDLIFLTDGDMYISSNSIKDILPIFSHKNIGGVSGHPISLETRENFFGYISHLFCEAAHKKRLNDRTTPMSGYLYAIKNIPGIFPIPEEIRAEDAYISDKILNLGYKTEYAPNALTYVHFPKNLNDWILQKTRSLGGNIQLKKFTAGSPQNHRNIFEDLRMALFPIFFARNIKEFFYSVMLYPLRLYLWIKIYINHASNNYSIGAWERIDSSKS